MDKLKQIVTSVRFWFLTVGAVIAILGVSGVIPADIQRSDAMPLKMSFIQIY